MHLFRRMRRAAGPALVGWLFADLLLALAMIFLVANASGQVVSIPPTPVPTMPPPTPTVPPPPCLEGTSYFMDISIANLAGFLSGDSTAQNDVENQIRHPKASKDGTAIPDLTNRQVGLTEIYAGSPPGGDSTTTDQVYRRMVEVAKDLGRQGYLFARTAYHGELLLQGHQYTDVQVEIYLFGKYTTNGKCVVP